MHKPILLLLAVTACSSDAPAPDQVRARITTDLVAVSDQAKASTADGKSLPDTAQFSLLSGALSGVLASADLGDFSSQISARMAPHMNLLDGTEEDPYDGAAAAKWLNENIFTDANHAGDGVYNVPASLACDDGTGVVDPECAQAFARIQLRIRVTEDDDLLKFALQIGPHHDEPLAVGLSAKLLSLTVDLDEAEDAIRALAPKGEPLPDFSLSGEATAKLEVLGTGRARVSLDIDRNISVKYEGAAITSQKAHVFSLALDGNAHSMEVALGLGPTYVRVPDEIDGTVEVDLAGMKANMTYAEGQALKIDNISLGDRTSAIRRDGETGLSIDLNPNDGRAFSAQLAGDTLTVSPRVDLRTTTNHTVLGDAVPVYDVTRVFLENGLRAHADQSVEVLGKFSIETNPASYGFAATAGQCVTGTDVYDANRGDYYTQFAAGACL